MKKKVKLIKEKQVKPGVLKSVNTNKKDFENFIARCIFAEEEKVNVKKKT